MLERGLDVRPRLLTQFVVLTQRGDLAVAAEDLRTTPRALRRAVGDLERQTGEALLTEAGRRLMPTPAGALLARSAQRVLDAVDRFEGVARADRFTVRIAHVANADTADALLDDVAGAGRRVRMVERVVPDQHQLDDLAAHRLDVAVCTLPGPVPDGLECRLLRLDPLLVTRPGDGPLLAAAYGASWPAHDAAVEAYALTTGRAVEWVTVPVGSGRETSALLREAGDRPAILASSAAGAAELSIAALDPSPPHLEWHLVWRRDDEVPAVRSFVAAARRVAHRRGWLDALPDETLEAHTSG